MNPRIAALAHEIRRLEEELEVEFARRRAELAYTVLEKAVRFEEAVLERHREVRSGLAAYLFGARPLFLLSAPIIYSLIVPLLLIDLWTGLYQRVCFPLYGIAPARRRDYLAFDRSQLAYLNAIEKLNCAYCSYANGILAWAREVAARTEQYWCPIKHARRLIGTHERYSRFADYGDAESYHEELQALRAELSRERAGEPAKPAL